MGPLEVVDVRRPGCYPAAHGLPHARRAWPTVVVGDRDGVLAGVDGDAGTGLLAGQAALAGLPVHSLLDSFMARFRGVSTKHLGA